MSRDGQRLALLCRVGSRLCALPLAEVAETMRPMPVAPLAGAPGFVLGVAIIRGAAVPVVDTAALLGDGDAQATRLVTLRVDGRQVALMVDEVLGVRAMAHESLRDLPPLLRGAPVEAVSAIGALDSELLLVLESARMVPEDVWSALEAHEGSP